MIVVTGATGQLGTAFASLLPDAMFLTRSQLDLSDVDSIGPLFDDLRPSFIVNCAAYTAVDRAESEPMLAEIVNAVAVGRMAEWAAESDCGFVTFSTDYVFDGKASSPYVESSPTNPINVYGKSKREGEALALQAHPGAIVIRTAWLLSKTHPNFVTKITDKARSGPVQVVTDQTGSPTVVEDLASATLDLMDGGAAGLFHMVNSGETTWFELARAAVEAAGLDPSLVEETTSDSFPTVASRPSYSVLASERDEVVPLPHWRDRIPDLASSA